MKDNEYAIRLGLEELAVSLSLVGRPEAAKGFLLSHLGELNEDEERGRLLAAHHSLLAKNILYMEGERPRIKSEFSHILRPLVQSDFFLRCSRKADGEPEQVLSFYFRDGYIVSHAIEHGVVHELAETDAEDEVIADVLAFFDAEETKRFDVSGGKLTREQVEEVRKRAQESSESADQYLAELNVPNDTRELFVRDLREPLYRGSAMRVITTDEELLANEGFLLLRSRSGRMWHMQIIVEDEQPFVTLQAATPTDLSTVTRALLM